MKLKFFLTIILLLGIFLRIYNFRNTVRINSDQALAFIMAQKIIDSGFHKNIQYYTTLGNINFLPPVYFYFVALLYFFTQTEIAVTFGFAVINIISIYLIYKLSMEISGNKAALITALLFSISYEMIKYSRYVWGPHLISFSTLLLFLLLLKAYRRKKSVYLVLTGILLPLGLVHGSFFLLLPSILSIYFISFVSMSLSRLKKILLSIFPFINLFISYIPLLLFESTHGFHSINGIYNIIFGSGINTFLNVFLLFPFSLFQNIHLLLRSLILIDNKIVSAFILILILLLFFKRKRLSFSKHQEILLFIIFPLFSGLFTLSLLGINNFSYRLAPIYPFIFISIGFLFTKPFKNPDKHINHYLFTCLHMSFILIYIFFNFHFFKLILERIEPPFNHQLRVGEYILEETRGEDFNINAIYPVSEINYLYTADYWYAIGKIKGIKEFDLNENYDFLKIRQNKDIKNIFLVCRGFDSLSTIEKNCLQYFRSKENLSLPISTKNIDDSYIYRF